MSHAPRTLLAAGALKLGGLAAFSAEASVVYVDLVPDLVVANTGFPGPLLDLNGDGADDFTLAHDATSTAADGQNDALAIVASDPTFVFMANDAGGGNPVTTRFGTGDTIDLTDFANANKVGLVVKGRRLGLARGWQYTGANTFQSDRAAETIELVAAALPGSGVAS